MKMSLDNYIYTFKPILNSLATGTFSLGGGGRWAQKILKGREKKRILKIREWLKGKSEEVALGVLTHSSPSFERTHLLWILDWLAQCFLFIHQITNKQAGSLTSN